LLHLERRRQAAGGGAGGAERGFGVGARGKPGRSHEDDRVLHSLLLEAGKRLEIFRENAQGPRLAAVEEFPVVVGVRLSSLVVSHGFLQS
jgi:hypothetical protein